MYLEYTLCLWKSTVLLFIFGLDNNGYGSNRGEFCLKCVVIFIYFLQITKKGFILQKKVI